MVDERIKAGLSRAVVVGGIAILAAGGVLYLRVSGWGHADPARRSFEEPAPVPELAVASRLDGASSDLALRGASSDAPAPSAPAERPAEEHSVSATLALLQDLEQEGEEDRRRYRDLLQKLLDVGSEEALQGVASLLRDPSFHFAGKAGVFGDLLQGTRHPAIIDAAHDILDHCVKHGLVTWFDADGFIEIIAEKGDRRDVQALLDVLRLDDGNCRSQAAEGLAEVSDYSLGPEILSLIEEGHPLGPQMLASLAHWKDPYVQARIGELIQDDELSVGVRADALLALTTVVDPLELPAHLARFYDPQGGEEDRTVFIRGLHGLYRNRALDRDVVVEHMQPYLLRGLEDPSSAVVKETLTLITVINRWELTTPAVLQALRHLSARDPENSEVRQLIYEAERNAK